MQKQNKALVAELERLQRVKDARITQLEHVWTSKFWTLCMLCVIGYSTTSTTVICQLVVRMGLCMLCLLHTDGCDIVQNVHAKQFKHQC